MKTIINREKKNVKRAIEFQRWTREIIVKKRKKKGKEHNYIWNSLCVWQIYVMYEKILSKTCFNHHRIIIEATCFSVKLYLDSERDIRVLGSSSGYLWWWNSINIIQLINFFGCRWKNLFYWGNFFVLKSAEFHIKVYKRMQPLSTRTSLLKSKFHPFQIFHYNHCWKRLLVSISEMMKSIWRYFNQDIVVGARAKGRVERKQKSISFNSHWQNWKETREEKTN